MLNLICECAPENGFAQDALEWAIHNRCEQIKVALTGSLEDDARSLMARYDLILAAYRKANPSRPNWTRLEAA